MSLISPKLTEFVLLLVAVAAVVVSGPLGEDLLTSVMLELVRALLLLIQSVVMLAVVVVSVVVEAVERGRFLKSGAERGVPPGLGPSEA